MKRGSSSTDWSPTKKAKIKVLDPGLQYIYLEPALLFEICKESLVTFFTFGRINKNFQNIVENNIVGFFANSADDMLKNFFKKDVNYNLFKASVNGNVDLVKFTLSRNDQGLRQDVLRDALTHAYSKKRHTNSPEILNKRHQIEDAITPYLDDSTNVSLTLHMKRGSK